MKIVLNYECPTTHTKSTEYPCKKRIHATGKIGLLGECQFCKTKKAKEIHEEIVVRTREEWAAIDRAGVFAFMEDSDAELPATDVIEKYRSAGMARNQIMLEKLGYGGLVKICRKCGKGLELNNFHKDRTRKDGLKSWCKECSNVRKR